MKFLTSVVLVVACLAATGLLVLGLYPGQLSKLFWVAALTSILWAPLALAAAVGGGYWLRFQRISLDRPAQLRLLCAGVVLLSSGLLTASMFPRRLAFAAVRDEFEMLAQSAPTAIGPGGVAHTSLNRRLGPWWVSDFDVDPRGGVYFRTGQRGDGPDRISFGVVWRPNHKGSPYGAADYLLTRINDDWYWFQASDDWY